jgi:hypothetical protein
MGGVKRFFRKAIPKEIKRPFNQLQGIINRAIPREIKPVARIFASMALGNYVFSPLLKAAGSAIGASATAASGVGNIVGNILTSSSTAQGLAAATLTSGGDWKNVALALLPGAVEGKTFLGTTISPVIARSIAIGGGISGDYRQALMSGVTAGMIESSLNTKIGQWITNKAPFFGLGNVSGLKEALISGGSVYIYENQRQSLFNMQNAMRAEYARLEREAMEEARKAELEAIQAEEARLNRQQQIEEEMERQRLEFIAQEEAKAEERKRIERPMSNKAFVRRMRAHSNLEEVRGLYEGLSVHIGLLAA